MIYNDLSIIFPEIFLSLYVMVAFDFELDGGWTASFDDTLGFRYRLFAVRGAIGRATI